MSNMDSALHTTSKRPPKLRSACNECHSAKVRCSGEKTGCQRCLNLRLKCAFSISRIGKVPGKRSKANRAASAAAAASTPVPPSISASSISTPIMSPPHLVTAHAFDSHSTSTKPVWPLYPFSHGYPVPASAPSTETPYTHSYPGYPIHSHTLSEGIPSFNNCWTSEPDILGVHGPGLLSPDWDIDAPAFTSQSTMHPSSYSDTLPGSKFSVYINVLHSIDQTLQDMKSTPTHETTLDAILPSTQRYITSLLELADHPAFTASYTSDHLLFTVVLEKIVCLFTLGHADFRRQMTIYKGMGMGMGVGCAGGGGGTCPEPSQWVRVGAFGIEVIEQMALWRKVFIDEIRRAGVCFDRLSSSLSPGSPTGLGGGGRHEELVGETKRRLNELLEDLETDYDHNHGFGFGVGVHLLGDT